MSNISLEVYIEDGTDTSGLLTGRAGLVQLC